MPFFKESPNADLKSVLRSEPDLGAPFAEYHEALLRGPSPFSIGERELIGAYVSALNGCDFCHGEHQAVAEAFGIELDLLDAIIADPNTDRVSEKLRPVLNYSKKLTETPARMVQADADAVFAAGWDDQALYHIVCLCGLFAMNNRIINGLGIPPHEPGKLAATVERLKAEGYASTAAFIRGEWKE